MTEIMTNPPLQQADACIERLPLLTRANGDLVATCAEWSARREELLAQWRDYLGPAPFAHLEHTVRTEPEEPHAGAIGQPIWIRTAPGYDEQCYLMRPADADRSAKRPAVVVFFYDVETPAGLNGRHTGRGPGPNTLDFARRLTQRGYVTLTLRWFMEGYRSSDSPRSSAPLSERYRDSVRRFEAEQAGCKPLRRVIADASRAVDFLESLPFVDRSRIGCMGHSLGGKMALYSSAFEPRFSVVAASEPGIGLRFSNWDAPWYLDERVRDPAFHLDHHHLLALIAPRPFLLIGGEDADGDRSWAYLNSAREVYHLSGAAERLAMLNHRAGHRPTPEATDAAYAWFDRWL